MCGIIGFSGAFDQDALRSGLDRLAHRGPDGRGVYFDEPRRIGLGHVRLSVLDLSSLGRQPMSSDDGSVTLIFNGEIYNFRELREALEAKGFRFRSHSDTEVLLNLYLAEGEAMLPRLNGIFAFAIWDRRSETLLIARDAFGVKPLYFCEIPKGVAFASELKGLLRLIPEVRELNPIALHRYLTYMWCPGEGTPLKGVLKLGPGEALTVRAGRIARRWAWYRLPVARNPCELLSESDAVAGTANQLRKAVHRQMVADVPVGAFLSGGLDSSSVVAFAREINPDIHCYTIDVVGGQEEESEDDLSYAKLAAKRLGVSLDIVRVDSGEMASDIERMVMHLDEPLADFAALNVLYISKLARDRGVKVLLSGMGGDDLFSGYRRHTAMNYLRYWDYLPKTVRAAISAQASRLDQRRTWQRRITKLIGGASMDGDLQVAAYFAWTQERDLGRLFCADVREAAMREAVAQPMLDFLAQDRAGVEPLQKMLTLDQRFFLADHNLIYTDKMSMAVGLEARVPFLDLELVEFASRVPLSAKQKGMHGKWVLKKAMEPFLPKEIIYRPKAGFGVPLRRWMRQEFHNLLSDYLSPESIARRGLFDSTAVQNMINDNSAGRIDANYTLLSLLCIEIWCRSFLDDRNSTFASAGGL